MKRELRLRARELRADGESVKDIARILDVAQSSVSLWVRDITLTDEQIALLEQKRRHYAAQNRGAQTNRKNGLALRQTFQQEGRLKAREKHPLHMMGCMLYWAEGAKSRNKLQFANSDPNMISLFMRFLREELDVQNDAIRVYLHCHTTDLEEQHKLEAFWMTLLGLPSEQLGKTYVKQGSEIVHGTLRYGVCRLSIDSTALLQHIYGAIQEYGGFDEPAWLL
jgi:predicted transcriptional regulator